MASVPRLCHHIWIPFGENGSPHPPPDQLQKRERAHKNNPTWKFVMWDGPAINRFLNQEENKAYAAAYRAFEYDIQRVDYIRYAILYRYGGVYMDFDAEPLQSLDVIVCKQEDAPCLILAERKGRVANHFLASSPNHPFWRDVLAAVEHQCRHRVKTPLHPLPWYIYHTSGAHTVEEVLRAPNASAKYGHTHYAKSDVDYAHDDASTWHHMKMPHIAVGLASALGVFLLATSTRPIKLNTN